jgi:hypothetical protein
MVSIKMSCRHRLDADSSELETAGSSNGDAARLQLERNTKLQNEVKALKQELQRKDAEEARSKAASAKVQAESGIVSVFAGMRTLCARSRASL